MLYIFFGEDYYSRNAAFKDFQTSLGDEEFIDMNTTFLNANEANVNEVLAMIGTVPFLASSRVVVIEDLLSMFEGPKKSEFGQWALAFPVCCQHLVIAKDYQLAQHHQPYSISRIRRWGELSFMRARLLK